MMKKTTSPSDPSTSPRERMRLRRLTLRRLTTSDLEGVAGGRRNEMTGEDTDCNTRPTTANTGP
jgi:hypothetical protein